MTGQEALSIIDHLLETNQQTTLKDVQSAIVLQVWAGNSYQSIGGELGYDSDYIKQIAAQLWKILSSILGVKVAKGNLQSILQRYQTSLTKTNWGEAIDVSYFYGRQNSLQTLQNWLLDSHCRMVGIFGWGGIGKTALSVKLAQQLESRFEYVVWRSLRHTPKPSSLLNEILSILTGSEVPESSINVLMQQLRQKRCLLVLDNVESILQSGNHNGSFLAGYEDYGQILERISDENHQSCLLITSREKPNGMTMREGIDLPVRSLQLDGLSTTDAQGILQDKGVIASLVDQESLISYVHGNPLAIKLVATNIQNLFSGNIQEFLAQGKTVFNNLWELLDQQFERLSTLQQQVMYWLAINREGVTPKQLQAELFPSTPLPQVLGSLETLRDRSLVETTKQGLTQQPVIMEYVTDRFIQQIETELITGELDLFKTHAIIEAHTQDYLRDAQVQLILQPLIDLLAAHFPTTKQLQEHLAHILSNLHSQTLGKTDYAAGNLLNLLCHLKVDLQGFDFSGLAIRQAYLLDTTLHNVDFTGSQITQSVFTETFGIVLGLAYSPDGRRIAISDTKGGIQIRDAYTLEQVSRCRGHWHWTWAVHFSPDGKYLVSASDDYQVKLWDVINGECLHTYTTGQTNSVNTVAFSPDGQTIATLAEDNTIRLLRAFPGRLSPEIRTLTGHDSPLWSIAFSPDGSTLISGGEDCTVRWWKVSTGECLAVWTAHEDWIRSVAFSTDNRSIATASHDCVIKIWDITTQQCLQTLRGHQKGVSKVAFSPDGQQLVSSASDQTIKLWDVHTGICTKTLLGHRSHIWNVVFHPNGQQVTSGGDDHTIKVWNLKLGRCINTLIGYNDDVLSLAISPDGRHLASGYGNKTLKIWNVAEGNIARVLHDHSNRIWSVKFSPDGKLLASGSADYKIKLYDWQLGTCVQTLSGHASWVWKVVFSPDGQTLASSSYDQTVKLWDVATGECLRTIPENNSVYAVAFSPDGQLLASCTANCGGAGGVIKLYNANSGEYYQSLIEHTNDVRSIAFSSDSQWLISASYDQTIKLWDVSTGKCLQTITGHQGGVLTAKFSPDDRLIISGGIDGVLKVWDVRNGQCLHTFTGHNGLIDDIEVANIRWPGMDQPKLLAFSASIDETIKVWDLEARKCLTTWRSKRPYEGMKIDKVKGLTKAQQSTLKSLGAVVKDKKANLENLEASLAMNTYLLVFKAIFWGKQGI